MQCDLEELRSDHAHARLPGDLTGQSVGHVMVVRHPRFRGHSQLDWRDMGIASIMASKPSMSSATSWSPGLKRVCKSSYATGLPDASSSGRTSPGSWRDWKLALEANPELQLRWHEVECARVAGQPPAVPGAGAMGAYSWVGVPLRQTASAALTRCCGESWATATKKARTNLDKHLAWPWIASCAG